MNRMKKFMAMLLAVVLVAQSGFVSAAEEIVPADQMPAVIDVSEDEEPVEEDVVPTGDEAGQSEDAADEQSSNEEATETEESKEVGGSEEKAPVVEEDAKDILADETQDGTLKPEEANENSTDQENSVSADEEKKQLDAEAEENKVPETETEEADKDEEQLQESNGGIAVLSLDYDIGLLADIIESKTLYVEQDANLESANGTSEYPYADIQSAINYIGSEAVTDKAEWTIIVKTGTYSRFTILDGLDGLTIKADEDADVTVSTVDNSESPVEVTGGYPDTAGISIRNADRITLRGLTINVNSQSDPWYAAAVSNYSESLEKGDNITIDHCTFVGNESEHGVFINTGTTQFSITNCEFSNFDECISIYGDGTVIDKATVSNNAFSNSSFAVHGYYFTSEDAADGGELTLESNNITGTDDLRCKIVLQNGSIPENQQNCAMKINITNNELTNAVIGVVNLSGAEWNEGWSNNILSDNNFGDSSFFVEAIEPGTIEYYTTYTAPEGSNGYWVSYLVADDNISQEQVDYINELIADANNTDSTTLSITNIPEGDLIKTFTQFKDGIYWVSEDEPEEPPVEEKPENPETPVIDWEISKSKEATNLDSNFESEVTLSLPAADYKPEIDIVFVIDDTSATSSIFADSAIELLDELMNKDKLQINFGLITFDAIARDWLKVTSDGAIEGLVSLSENYDTICNAIRTEFNSGGTGQEKRLGGTNTEWPLAMAQDMLANGTGTDKHVVMFSDMYGYVYRGTLDLNVVSEGETGYDPNLVFENVPLSKRDNNIGNMGTLRYPSPLYTSWNDVYANRDQGSVYPDGFFRDSVWNDYWTVFYGLTDSPENNIATKYNIPYGAQSFSGFEKSSCLTYDQIISLRNLGVQVTIVNNDFVPESEPEGIQIQNIKNGMLEDLANNQITVIQEETSNGGEFTSDQLENIFALLENKLIQLVDAGSYVEDYMGYTTDYNFDFINDVSRLSMEVGDQTYAAETIVNGKEYGFAPDGNGGYNYTLVYEEGNKADTEHFVWTTKMSITKDAPVQLTYSVKLTNPKTAAGTYGQYDADGSEQYAGLYTNNSATLYPVDSNGNEGTPEEFNKPTVSYTVPETPVPEEPTAGTATLNITKKVQTNKGEAKKVSTSFYASIFTDDKYQNRYGNVIELKLTDASEVTVTVNVETPADGSSRTYYVMETDKDGNVVSSGKDFGYQIDVKGSQVTVSKTAVTADIVITNQQVKSGSGSHGGSGSSGSGDGSTGSAASTPQQVGSAKTGDTSNITLYIVLAAVAVAALGACGVIVYKKRKLTK